MLFKESVVLSACVNLRLLDVLSTDWSCCERDPYSVELLPIRERPKSFFNIKNLNGSNGYTYRDLMTLSSSLRKLAKSTPVVKTSQNARDQCYINLNSKQVLYLESVTKVII